MEAAIPYLLFMSGCTVVAVYHWVFGRSILINHVETLHVLNYGRKSSPSSRKEKKKEARVWENGGTTKEIGTLDYSGAKSNGVGEEESIDESEEVENLVSIFYYIIINVQFNYSCMLLHCTFESQTQRQSIIWKPLYCCCFFLCWR